MQTAAHNSTSEETKRTRRRRSLFEYEDHTSKHTLFSRSMISMLTVALALERTAAISTCTPAFTCLALCEFEFELEREDEFEKHHSKCMGELWLAEYGLASFKVQVGVASYRRGGGGGGGGTKT